MDSILSKKKARQYLIDLHRWRSVVSLIECVISFGFTIVAIMISLSEYIKDGSNFMGFFQYFTTWANMLSAISCVFIIPFAIDGIKKKRCTYPRWLSLLHYSGTICTTLTFVFAICFILPWDRYFAIGGANFFLHLICPIAVLVVFIMSEANYRFTRKDSLICMMPIGIYACVYFVMVVLLKGWPDIYGVNTIMPFYFSIPLVAILSYGITVLIRKVANYLTDYRQKRMMKLWKDDMEPVEIKIELYGLGRHYGIHDDINSLDIPYDIIQSLADRYNLDINELLKAYVKGLMDAVKEKDSTKSYLNEKSI